MPLPPPLDDAAMLMSCFSAYAAAAFAFSLQMPLRRLIFRRFMLLIADFRRRFIAASFFH